MTIAKMGTETSPCITDGQPQATHVLDSVGVCFPGTFIEHTSTAGDECGVSSAGVACSGDIEDNTRQLHLAIASPNSPERTKDILALVAAGVNITTKDGSGRPVLHACLAYRDVNTAAALMSPDRTNGDLMRDVTSLTDNDGHTLYEACMLARCDSEEDADRASAFDGILAIACTASALQSYTFRD